MELFLAVRAMKIQILTLSVRSIEVRGSADTAMKPGVECGPAGVLYPCHL